MTQAKLTPLLGVGCTYVRVTANFQFAMLFIMTQISNLQTQRRRRSLRLTRAHVCYDLNNRDKFLSTLSIRIPLHNL